MKRKLNNWLEEEKETFLLLWHIKRLTGENKLNSWIMVIIHQFYNESYWKKATFQTGIEEHRKKNCILKFINNEFSEFLFVVSSFGKSFHNVQFQIYVNGRFANLEKTSLSLSRAPLLSPLPFLLSFCPSPSLSPLPFYYTVKFSYSGVCKMKSLQIFYHNKFQNEYFR